MPCVLLIDDDPLIQGFVQHAVPTWQILVATTGRKALALLREHQSVIDVIVLDVGLPGIDGRLVGARIRVLAPLIPIVPFTGNELADDELREMGCAPAVLKGTPPEVLAASLETALHSHPPATVASPLMTFVQEYAAHLEHEANRQARQNTLLAEDQPILEATLDDLDLQRVSRHIAHAVIHRGYTGSVEPVTYLQTQRCLLETELGLSPTVAGILYFAPHPERWIDASGIDIAVFHNDSVVPFRLHTLHHVRGPIFIVIEQTVAWLWSQLDRGGHRLSMAPAGSPPPTMEMLRELTINALAHRDWGLRGSMIRIQIFPTHIEWVTPGGLPAGVTSTNIRAAQISRNPTLMRLLDHAGVVTRLGVGMDTVLDLLQANGNLPLTIINDGSFVTIQLHTNVHVSATLPYLPNGLLTERQSAILVVIRRRRACTANDLAVDLCESVRSIQRDLKVLVDARLVVHHGETHARRYELP